LAPSPNQSPTPTSEATLTVTPFPSRPGDANCNGRVDAADLTALVLLLASNGSDVCGFADANQSGEVDALDVDATIQAIFPGSPLL